MDHNYPERSPTTDYEESINPSEFPSVTTSSICFAFEHGRRYQGFLKSRYGLPNDDTEKLREGIKHRFYVDYILEGKLFLAHIGEHPQKIVDLGTGVGYWAQDVAERFPSARVIGTDISPIQPHWTAPNVEFRVEDLEDEKRPWTRICRGADLIHIRAFLQTVQNPGRIIENLKPEGWIELHELNCVAFSEDNTVGKDHPLNQLFHLIHSHWAKKNRLAPWHHQQDTRSASRSRVHQCSSETQQDSTRTLAQRVKNA